MIRFATVGSGWIVDTFLAGASQVDGLHAAAVYSRTEHGARTFAKKHGIERTFTDLEELACCPEIDAVYIASPNAFHFSQSMLLLQHKKHVLCEKTATIRREDAQTLVDTALENGVVFLEAIIPMYLPQMVLLEQALDQIGAVTLARFDFSQFSSRYPQLEAGELPNIFNPALCTGSLMDLGVYCVYAAVHLFGQPESIRASVSLLPAGADVAGSAVFEYPGKQVVITHSKAGQGRVGSEIIGTRGTIVIGSISKLEGMRLIGLDGTRRTLSGEQDKASQMECEARYFNDLITHAERRDERYTYLSRLFCDVSETLHAMRGLCGIHFPQDDARA